MGWAVYYPDVLYFQTDVHEVLSNCCYSGVMKWRPSFKSERLSLAYSVATYIAFNSPSWLNPMHFTVFAILLGYYFDLVF